MTPARTTDVVISTLGEADVPAADAVFRLAFGTRFGLPDPSRFAEGAELVRSRHLADPASAFKAEAGGELVGSAFVTRWGSFAVFGPLSVRPDFWDFGVGTRLWEASSSLLASWGISQAGLFTPPDSTKHVHLYQKLGFWPQFLTALTAKPVEPGEHPIETPTMQTDQETLIGACRDLTGAIQPGLDLEREIRVVAGQGIGDVVVVRDGATLAGFAVCHVGGKGSEAVPGTCYVKFGAAAPGPTAAERFDRLLDACEGFAAAHRCTRLEAGVNTARHDAYRALLKRGHRTFAQGVAMQRPNTAGFNRPDVFVIDDWR